MYCSWTGWGAPCIHEVMYAQGITLHIWCIIIQEMGVKRPCVLSLHRFFKINTGVVVDDLHGLYLGVAKTFLKLWFDKSTRTQQFYIGNDVRCIQSCNHIFFEQIYLHILFRLIYAMLVSYPLKYRILSQEPLRVWKTIDTGKVIEKLCSITVTVIKFIASEMRNWILYFSLPVLHGILPEPYISHFSLLVTALQLLSSSTMSHKVTWSMLPIVLQPLLISFLTSMVICV